MRKALLFFLLILSSALPLLAQGGFTTVSATVVDPSNNPYINCSGEADFVPSPTATTFPTLSGSTFQTSVPISSCDSFGALTITLADNAQVSDGHTGGQASQWRFSICSSTAPKVCFQATLTITGATQNISAALKAASAPLPVVTNPASLAGNNAFTGNNTHSGTETFSGPLVAPTIGPSAGQQHTIPAVASGNVAVLPTVTTTETGSGAVVKATSPSITTPTLTSPVISGGSINLPANALTLLIAGILNGTCYVDGARYTTIMGAYNDTANCKVVAVPTLGGACYSETVSSTWTLNRAGVPIIFLGCATVTFGTNIITVPQGTGTVSILAPMGPQNADGVKFVYTGTASFLTVGSSAGSTLNPTFKNIRFDLTGAGNASIALDTKFAGNCDYDVDIRGNGAAGTAQIALKFDGTGTGGSSCTGKTIRATVAAVNIGLYGTGTGGNAFNNNDVYISTTGLNGTNSQLVSIDQTSSDNRVYISNCQSLTTCAHASGSSQFNTFYSANQSITNDVVFDASTTNNVAYLNAGITAFSDAGTHNRVIPNGSNPGIMSFSCTGVLTANSTLLLTGGACTTTSATGGPQWPIDNGNWIYRNLRCTSGAGGVNASSGVVTVRNVGSNTSLTATFGTGTAANDLNSAHALIGPGPGSVLDITITSQVAETLKNIACTLERE